MVEEKRTMSSKWMHINIESSNIKLLLFFQSYYFYFYYPLIYISIIHVVGFYSQPVFLHPCGAGDFFHHFPTTIIYGVWTCCSCDLDHRFRFAFHSGSDITWVVTSGKCWDDAVLSVSFPTLTPAQHTRECMSSSALYPGHTLPHFHQGLMDRGGKGAIPL